jgi:hypothetical protein
MPIAPIAPAAATGVNDESGVRLATRRQSLVAISKFAAATAPAMLVLLGQGTAQAASDQGIANASSEGLENGINPHTGRHSHA